MRYLGLDLGTRTLGTAISDTTLTIATTHETIRFNDSDYDSLIPKIKELIEEYKISKIILGFPKNMNNSIGERGQVTLEFKEKIEKNWVKTFILGKLDLRQFLKSCKITFEENLWFNR